MAPRSHCLLRAGLAVGAFLLLLAANSQSQEPDSGGRARVMVSDTGLPGIDRGLRSQDPPMEPYGRGTRGRALVSRSRAYVPGRVIVKFKSGTSRNAVSSAMQTADATGIARPPYANFDVLDVPMDADVEAIAAELGNNPDVEYAQPRYLNYPMLRPNDPLYPEQWNFTLLDMERAWDIQPLAGADVIVAVLDTGVAFRTATVRYNSSFEWQLTSTSPFLPPLGIVDIPFAVAPELGEAKFVAPRDFIWEDNLPFDLDGHGTHVSGTIGQLTNNNNGVAGMAFNVRLMPVKVLQEVWDYVFGSPNEGTDDVVARGVRYAADNGAKVINMSFGRIEGGPAPAVADAIRYAVSRGAFVAVAAGNTADSNNAPNRLAQLAPDIDGMVAVGAVGRDRERAYYSTTNVYVEVAAPGGDQRRHGTSGGVLQQTLDQDLLHTYLDNYRPPRADSFVYRHFQGTSQATAHVSAFAALLIQQGITSPAAIEHAMKQFATDLGPRGVDSEFGAGLINPRATLRGLGLAR